MTFLAVCFLASGLKGAPMSIDSSGPVTQIRIDGNRVTKEYIIQREIQHPLGVPFDSVMASEDRNRIDNLGIFGDIKSFLTPNGDGTQTLSYRVVETWRIFPIPVLLYQQDTGWSFGAAVMIKNFRGRNEILQVGAAGGGTAFGALQFRNPWIAGDHISLQSHMYLSTFDHPFLGYNYREWDVEATLGRYFGYERKLWLTGSFEKRRVRYFHKEGELYHRYFQSKLVFLYDTRDLYIDPSRGMMIYNEFRPEFGLDNASPHNLYWQGQLSIYRTIFPGTHKWVAGGSLFFHKYFGDESIPYKILMVGGSQSVRGWTVLDSIGYKREPWRAGLNQYHVSFEMRQTLIPKHLTSLGTEFGLILAEFIDVGSATDDVFFAMFKRSPIAGIGAGIRIFVPGAQLLRLDYAIGYHNGEFVQSSWHLDLGHKF